MYCYVSRVSVLMKQSVCCDRILMGCSECVVTLCFKIHKIKVNYLLYYKAYYFCAVGRIDSVVQVETRVWEMMIEGRGVL